MWALAKEKVFEKITRKRESQKDGRSRRLRRERDGERERDI